MARRLLMAGRIGPARPEPHALPHGHFLLGENLREVSVEILVGGSTHWAVMLASTAAPPEHISWCLQEAIMDVGRASGFVTGEEA